MTAYRNKYLEMLKTDFGKKPFPDEPPKLTKKPVLSVLSVPSIGPFQIFHPPTEPGASLAVSARGVAVGSSDAGLSSTATINPTAGFAGSAPLLPKGVALATFAGFPRTVKRGPALARTSNGQASSQVVGGRGGYRYSVICRGELIVARSRDRECDAARALLARGYTGKLTMLDGKTGIPRTIIDIEKAARLRIAEESRDGLRFRRADPADSPYSREEASPDRNRA